MRVVRSIGAMQARTAVRRSGGGHDGACDDPGGAPVLDAVGEARKLRPEQHRRRQHQ